IPMKMTDKQSILEINKLTNRMRHLVHILANEQKVLDLEQKIGKRVQTSMERTQKEYYLREQLKAIQKELSESDGKLSDVDQLRIDIEEAKMPEHVETVALEELARYERVPQNSAES